MIVASISSIPQRGSISISCDRLPLSDNSYAAGQSEVVMGQAIKKYGWNRNDIVISTKLNWGGANGEVLVNNHGLSRKHM